MPRCKNPQVALGQHFATVEMALGAPRVIERFELALAEGDALPKPVIDLALNPRRALRLRSTRRASNHGGVRV